ncbi:hypothetical protein HGM15179_011626, partial [Zosterops borbonicus]
KSPSPGCVGAGSGLTQGLAGVQLPLPSPPSPFLLDQGEEKLLGKLCGCGSSPEA